ncbi:PA1414 family protein [Pseudomonas mangiferae]|nr:PA1414 family protein [Pseudomonas mangiferae]
MRAWLSRFAWQVSVALGLQEPPRLQPIPVRHDARAAARQRRR